MHPVLSDGTGPSEQLKINQNLTFDDSIGLLTLTSLAVGSEGQASSFPLCVSGDTQRLVDVFGTDGLPAYAAFRNDQTLLYLGAAGPGWIYQSTPQAIMGTWSVSDLVFATNAVERMRINTAGYLGIGPSGTNARRPLDVLGNWPQIVATPAPNYDTAVMGNPGSGVEFGGHNYALNAWAGAKFNGTYYNSPSDERVKENIVDADLDSLYERFKQLRLRNFEFKEGFNGKDDDCICGCQTGWIAQEVEAIFPKCVSKSKKDWGLGEMEDFRSIDRTKLSDLTAGVLLKAISKIEDLTARIAQLEGEKSN